MPSDLELLSWYYVVDFKWNSELRLEANIALENLAKDFFQVFWEKIKVVSAYRSYNYQQWIKANWCSDLFCANPWYSEHQTWLAIDLWEASNEKDFLSNKKYAEYFEWMKENAYKYGFHNTYQKWVEIDWYAVEPWHWRYVGVDLARMLFENKTTIAEYNKNLK
jgi:D-alanyl-D-alanine carboxypeptidase